MGKINQIKMLKELTLFVRDEHVKTKYPLIFGLLVQKFKASGIDVKDIQKEFP